MKRFGYYFIHWYLRLTELWGMGLLLSVVVLDKEFLLRDMVYVIPLVITVSAVSALFLLAIAVFLKRNGRMHAQFHNGLFQVIEFLTIYVFLIVIFAPTHFGVLNGSEWARAFSRIEYVQDILRLLVSLVASFWVCRYAKKHNFPIMRYVLIAACGICIVSICSNGYRAHIAGSVKEHIDDWHVLGTSKNIIVLIADGMQGSFVESVMNENSELRTAYTDFTLYSKALSPHVFTSYGIPAILHGSFYDWTKHTSTHEILDNAKKDNFVLDANVKEYQTQEFMDSNGLLFGSQKQYNISYYNYVDRVRFYLKIAASRILPITILQYIFGTNSDDSVVVPKKYDALNFLHDFANYATTSSQSASLIVHHSMLPHPPLVFTRDGALIKQPIVGTYQQIKDEMYFTLQRYATLIQRLKQLGKWDSSLVIIVGDHGSHYEAKEDPYASVRGLSYFSVGSYNPVLIVKLPYASQSFTIDTRNVATTDVRSLIDYYLSLDNWRTQYVFPYGAMQSVWVTASPQKGKYEQYYSLADFQNLSRVTSIDSLPILFHSALTPSLQDYREARMHAYNEVSIVAPQGLLGAAMIGPVGAWLTDKPAWQFLQLDKKISGDIQINFIMYGLEIDDRPPQQELRFVVNNIPVGSVTVGRRGRYSLIIPKNIIDYKTRRLKIQIIPQNAVAPSDISKWNKDTKLSVFLSGFTVSEYHP